MEEDGQDEDEAVEYDIREKPESSKVSNELRNLHMFYNPAIKDVVEFAMVSGTDHDYSTPVNFKDVWHHEDVQGRRLWRKARSK